MSILRAFKTELIVNNVQKTRLLNHIGCARWAYNWAVSQKITAMGNKQKIPNVYQLQKELNILKKTHVPWMYDSSKCAPQRALWHCEKAFDMYFKTRKSDSRNRNGLPKFKSKKYSKQSFTVDQSVKITSDSINITRIGKLRLAEKDYIPNNHKILSATVSKRANKWFVSVLMEVPDIIPTIPNNKVIGIDLGIKTLATCSDGTTYANPKALKNNLKKLKRKQKQFSKKKKGSKNREKAKQKLAKIHYHISNIRRDCLHKITSKIINENQVIVLEDLKVSNMMKNHCLAQAISDVGLYEFRRQIEYKAEWNGRKVIFADTFYPSSKLCSCCGWKNSDLKLTDRVFECKVCDMKIDRDLNASLNLKQIYRESSSRIYASGDGSSIKETLSSPSLNEEFNRKPGGYTLKV